MPDKPTAKPTAKQLAAENAELRARLGDAEEILRAIRGGEVDALVLSTAEGDNIFELKGSEEPYRVMVEAMGEGALALARDGTILYSNRRFADCVKVPLGQIVGLPLHGMLAEQDRQGFDAMLVRGAEGDARETLTLQAADSTQIPALFSMSPLPQSEGKVISVVITDLSDVVAAAEARSRLALIVESSDDTIVSTTLNGVIESWNRAAEKLYGYTVGEALGQPLASLIVPSERTHEVIDELEAIRKGKRIQITDTIRLRKNGKLIEVSVKASPILDDTGKVVGASINARDITERKKAERLIEETGRMAHVGGWELDIASMNVIWTEEVGRIHEVPPDYTLNLSEAIDFYAPEDRPVIQQAVQRAIDFGEPYDVEVQFISAKGNHRWIQAIGRPELRGGKTVRLSGTFQDITERKLAEDALKKSEQRFQLAMDGANDGLWDWNLLTDEVYYSPRWLSMLGYAPDAFPPVLDTWSRLVHPDDRERVLQRVQDYLEGRADNVEMEMRMKHRDGHDVIILSRAVKVVRESDGKPIRLVGTHVDITERKQAEAALRHLNRALKTLSSVNRTLVHAVGEQQLLQGVCRVAVEDGGYLLAWVGYMQQDEAKSVKVMASHAVKTGYTKDIHVSWADVPEGCGPTGMAIRSGKTQYVQDIAHNPAMQPWHKKALSYGYRASIALPLIENGNPFGALTIYANETDAFNDEEIALLEEMAGDLSYGIHMLRVGIERDQSRAEQQQTLKQMQEGLVETVEAIAATVEMRDPYTAGHQRRVAELAEAIAGKLGLDEEKIQGIFLAGIVHDLGKIGIPAEILSYPGKLNETQFMLVRQHSQIGFDILKDVRFPWPIAQMVLQHHERLDGSGYPQGLKGKDILLEAKILSVADVVEAMSSHRPYRGGLGLEAALAEINDKRGTQLDAEVVDACTGLFREDGYELPVLNAES